MLTLAKDGPAGEDGPGEADLSLTLDDKTGISLIDSKLPHYKIKHYLVN